MSVSTMRMLFVCVLIALDVGSHSSFAQAPRLITFPSPPPVNQPFDGKFSILAHADAVGVWDASPYFVDDNYLLFYYSDCSDTCLPGELKYRSFPLHFPSLGSGTYKVRFIPIIDIDINPPLPPVAEFSLTVGAAPSSVPTMSVLASLVVVSLLIALAWRKLRMRKVGS